MSTSVLVINCGSSSIKYALVSERREDRIFGLAENLGSADARIKGIKWNFTKFLIGKDGKVINRYAPTTKPEAIQADIEKALQQ